MSEAMSKIRDFARSWQRKAGNPVAWGICLSTGALVVGVHLLFRHAHIIETATEVASMPRFIGRPEATADGAYVSFSRGTDTGGGLFVFDLKSGQQRLIYEDSGNRRQTQYGWSPDAKLLAFTGLSNGKNALMIYNERSGQIEIPLALYDALNEVEWLSPSSFILLKGGTTHLISKKQNAGLLRVDRHEDGTWAMPYYFAKEQVNAGTPGTETTNKFFPINGLMATSPNSVAWTTWDAIWELKFHDSQPVPLWKGALTNKIMSCSYSKDSGVFLLRLKNGNRQYLASYSSSSRQFLNLGELVNTNAVNVRWINHGKGYAYLVNESNSHFIFIKADYTNDAAPIQSFQQTGMREFTSAGNSVYGYGCLEGQPEGVVEYDATSGSSKYAVSTSPQFRLAKNVIPSGGLITNSLGEVHAYYLWTPINFTPGKKYSLVLAQQRNVWNGTAEAVANAGAFYLSVDRPDFNHPQLQHWTQDVMAAYRLMSKNPNIDTRNLYLSGGSDETGFVASLLNEEPALWKGAMLSSPIAFPDISRLRVSKLLIMDGESDEYNNFDKIKIFQRDAERLGIPVTVVALPAGHVLVSASAVRRSTQEFVRFLFE
jgi:predicted esterase